MKCNRQGARAVAQITGQTTRPRHVCVSCQRSGFKRHYAAAAAVAESQPESSDPQSNESIQPEDAQASGPRPVYRMNAGVVLSRPPVITRDLHPFEKAYYLYQRRLNERLALGFTRYFYFKKNTPADIDWKAKQKERITAARDIGKYAAYSKEGWHDELLVGDKISEPDHQVEALLKDAESPSQTGGPEANQEVGAEQLAATRKEVERPMPRITEADQKNDQRSLNRMLQRALYLVVQGEDGQWVFPTTRIQGRENLHAAAERTLTQTAGPNMNTWLVGNMPVGHYALDFAAPVHNERRKWYELGEKTFFMKGRIMTGQASTQENLHGFKDFKWLSKEEIQQLVTPHYWRMTQDMLAER